MTNIPPTFKFKGNREKSISLKAQARQFYNFVINQAEVGGLPFISRALRLSDGSLITVFSKKESNYNHRTGFILIDTSYNPKVRVEEESIYMESGFIDFISTGKCTEAAYRPGTLNYNAKVTSELDSLTPIQGKVKLEPTTLPESPFTGELLLDGGTSLSVGCKESKMVSEVVTPDPCGITYTSGGYCGLSLWARKTTMQKVPASFYTGKLRLFVQAMYGSTRDDFSDDGARLKLKDDSGRTYANLSDGEIKLEHSGIGSYWLYTIGPGGYALCYFNGFNLHMIPLLLTDVAQKFVEALVAHPLANDFKFKTKVEAYLLAYAKPVYDSSLWITIPVSGSSVLGDPLSYGWHTNWDGDEAHMVSFYADELNNRFVSNQYKLEITKTTSPEGAISFSAAVTITEANKPWANWSTSLHVFYYDEEEQQMMPVPKPRPTYPPDINFDAPVYCYTKLNLASGDAELMTVRAYNNKTTGISYNHDLGVTAWPSNHGSFAFGDRKTYSAGMLVGQTGFKLVSLTGTTSFLGEVDGSHTSALDEWIYMGGGWSPQQAGSNNYGSGSPWYAAYGWSYDGTQFGLIKKSNGSGGFIYAFADYEVGFYQLHIVRNNGMSVSTQTFMEVPWLACDCVIIGLKETTNYSSTYFEADSGSSYGQVHRDARVDAAVAGPGGSHVRTGTILHTASLGKLMGAATYQMPINNPVASNVLASIASGTIANDIKIHENVGTEVTTTVYTASAVDGTQSLYFAPVLSSPGTGTIDVVQASIMSGSYSNHTLYNSDYGFIKNASVGWA